MDDTILIQARQQSSTASFHEIIDDGNNPGSEIPFWFDNNCDGDSIRMDLSPIMHDNGNYFCGFACCAVFSIAPVDPTRATNARRPEIELYISNSKTHLRYAIIPVVLERRLLECINLDVKNCGYHWVYKQDHAMLQKFLFGNGR
jgi:hypothetical protein